MQRISSIYSDYLLVTGKQATATGLSSMLEGELSHDQITRMLKRFRDGDNMLWRAVKPSVRRIEGVDGILVFDDTVEEKAWMEENEIISWHFDHTKGKSVKGLNQLTALYYREDEQSQGISIPVSYELVRKTQEKWDAKRGTFKRVSAETKNEMMMRMLRGCLSKELKFKYIVADKWYASSDTMMKINHDLRKYFVFPLKSNQKIARSLEDKQNARYQSLSELVVAQVGTYLLWRH
ncbi:MAG: transposase [Bacteroidia bacterium]